MHTEYKVHNYMQKYVRNNDARNLVIVQELKRIVSKISYPELNALDMYNMKGEYSEYDAGNEERMVIFLNTSKTHTGNETLNLDTHIELYGVPIKVKNMLNPYPTFKVIEENGFKIASYNETNNQLYVHFNMFEESDSDAYIVIFENIINEVLKILARRVHRHSWTKSDNKENLIKQLTERATQASRRELERNESELRNVERDINGYKNELANRIRKQAQIMRIIKSLREGQESGQSVVKDLDMLVAHPKITDVHVLPNGKIKFFTVPLLCYDDKTDSYYKVGSFEVEVDTHNADVRFKGDTPKQSFWTDHDPHPHVSGSNGHACLGNMDSTVAELSAQNQIYALALMCIDFLESVNTDDTAGANVVRWDRCDEKGNIIAEGRERRVCSCCDEDMTNSTECDDCGGEICEDCQRIAIGTSGNERVLCIACRDENYYYNEERDMYVHDDYEEDEE